MDGSDYFERGSAVYHYDQHTSLNLVYGETKLDVDPIQSFLVDQSGLIWRGTNAHGISQVDLKTPFFPSFLSKKGLQVIF